MRVSVGGRARMAVVGMMVCLFGFAAGAQASDGRFQLGARAGASVNQYYVNIYRWDVIFDPGYSYEIGLAARYHLTERFSLTSELSFCQRLVTNYRHNGVFATYDYDENGEMVYMGDFYYEFKGSSREMAILLPVMLQFTPVKSVPFNLSAGIQFGLPFNYKSEQSGKRYTLDGEFLKEGIYYDDGEKDSRANVDFGAAVGIGYAVTPKIGVDARFVFNMNNYYDGSVHTWFMYWTLGVNYFL